MGAILGLLLALWYVLAETGSSDERPARGGDVPANSIDDVEAAQTAAYRILRGPEGKAPLHVTASVERAWEPRGDFRVTGAHSAPTPGGWIWVVTGEVGGESVTCAVKAGSGAVSCLPTALTTRAGLALGIDTRREESSTAPRGFLLIGIAPDWVERVRVGVAEGGARVLPVKHNVYSTRAGSPVVVEGYCRDGVRRCISLKKLGPRPE